MEKVEMIERLHAIVDFANEIAKALGVETPACIVTGKQIGRAHV